MQKYRRKDMYIWLTPPCFMILKLTGAFTATTKGLTYRKTGCKKRSEHLNVPLIFLAAAFKVNVLRTLETVGFAIA